MKKKHIIEIALVGVVAAGVLTACGKKVAQEQKETTTILSETKSKQESGTQDTDNEVEVEKNTDSDVDKEQLSVDMTVDKEEEKPETQKKEYTYTDLELTKYAKTDVNVRDLPSTEGKQLGILNKNQKVLVTGTCNETGWYRIAYNGSMGYVSAVYLVSEGDLNRLEQDEETEQSEQVQQPVTQDLLNQNHTIVSGDDIFGLWDCEGTSEDGSMYIGRSVYTNELFGFGLKIPKTARVFGHDFLINLSQEGIIKVCHIATGDEKGISIGVNACTLYQEFDVSTELAFLQDRQSKWEQGVYQYDEIETVTVEKNTYYYMKEKNASGEAVIYLVKKFDSHMLEITFSASADIDLKTDCLKYLE